MNSYLTDPNDFCRHCRGRGSHAEWDAARGVTVHDRCDACGGSGLKAIRICLSYQEGFAHAPD